MMQFDTKRIQIIARYVSIRIGYPDLHKDLSQEFIADIIDCRFSGDEDFCIIYRTMVLYFRRWEKPRVMEHTQIAYWKMCSRKPMLPSDFFELKELWNKATNGEKAGIFALMINYGEGKRANGTVECITQARRESSYLKNFRRKNGIKITNGNSKRTRIARRKRSMD